jgi:hypothetical protein
MDLPLEGLVESTESYEHLGETAVRAMDMRSRYEALLQERHVVVEPAKALLSFTEVFDAPPPVVWSWLNEPGKRARLSSGHATPEFRPIFRPGGRTTTGAVTHCIHGTKVEMRETVLDWKPFTYFTVEQDNSPMGIIRVTFQLEPLEGERTRLRVFLDGRIPKLPDFLGRAAVKLIFTRLFNYGTILTRARELIASEAAAGQLVPDLSSAS